LLTQRAPQGYLPSGATVTDRRRKSVLATLHDPRIEAAVLAVLAAGVAGCNQAWGIDQLSYGCGDTQTDPLHCGVCGHDCLGGACVAGQCQASVVAWGQAYPCCIRLDAENVYWLNSDSPDGALQVVPKSGGTATALVAPLGSPTGLVLDESHAYWASMDDSSVARAPLGGGAPEALAPGGQLFPTFLAVDANDLYCTDWNLYAVARVAKTGGAWTTLVSNENSPSAIVVAGATLVWGNSGVDVIDGAIRRMAIDATAVPSTLASALRWPTGLVLSGDYVYWTNNGDGDPASLTGSVMRVLVTGSAEPETLASGLPCPVGIAVDDSGVYWTDACANTLSRVRLGETTVEPIASGLASPGELAVDAQSFYWVSWETSTVTKLAK
jgi:hypothetical protein